ncbi:MAG: Fic family protein [Candidatus Delongbacteria bacterium]|nr:Fic family protein [Candidatus Delongbacteria bacterium]
MDISKKLIFSPELNNSITKKVGEIEKFQGKWEALKISESDFLKELRHIATIQSIGSSTRIEGSQLRDDDIRKLINELEITELETRDEQEVIGYWETLELLLINADSIELSQRYILQLHGSLLKYSSKDERQRGLYKNQSNKVVATYPDGSQKTIFNTTEPHLVQKEMNDIILWANNSLNEKNINPLVVIGTFVYEFLSIHPFHDGNGRLSRLLTTLLLLKEKYYFVQYVSFEHIIEKRKKEYYKALMDCQKDRYTVKENVGIWISFFLDCIIELSKQLEEKLIRITNNDVYINDRQKKIVALILSKGKLRTADIHKEIPDASLPTIKKDLKKLLDENIISKEGIGRSTTYMKTNER